MSDYLYFFNYSHLEVELFEGEFASLFGREYPGNYHFSDIFVPVDNSVYIKDVLKVLCRNSRLEILLEHIKDRRLAYDDYKVVYLKNKNSQIEYKKSLDLVAQIGLTISGRPKMNGPKTTLAITLLEGEYVFGELSHGHESWKKFLNKPHTFCNGLDLRMCKTLINLATGNNPDVSVVDPCCGMGAVVLEGLNHGVDIVGFDISRTNSYKARKNLEHFGYDPLLISRKAIGDLTIHRDVAIIDLPYNLYTPITRKEQEDIILAGLSIADKLILVAHEDYDNWFKVQGIDIKRKMTVRKFDKSAFIRIVYVLGSEK